MQASPSFRFGENGWYASDAKNAATSDEFDQSSSLVGRP
jgi:hypothetical protein